LGDGALTLTLTVYLAIAARSYGAQESVALWSTSWCGSSTNGTTTGIS